MAGVAHQHGVVQLLVGDGQLQVAAIFAEHVTAVSVDGERRRSGRGESRSEASFFYTVLNPKDQSPLCNRCNTASLNRQAAGGFEGLQGNRPLLFKLDQNYLISGL